MVDFNAIVNAHASAQHSVAPKLHALTKLDDAKYRYGPWEIDRVPFDAHREWHWVHKDYDGAPDADDVRYGFAPTLEAACEAIDDFESWN